MRGRECRTHYIPRVICFRRVKWLAAVRTWLVQGAKHLIFLRIEKNRGVFHEFYARFFMNARFILWSARAFGRNHARVSLHSRPRPQRTIWIERSHCSIFEFLAHAWLSENILYGVYSAFDTLFPSLLSKYIKSWVLLSPKSTAGRTSRVLLADVIPRINKANLALYIASCMLQCLPCHDRSEVHREAVLRSWVCLLWSKHWNMSLLRLRVSFRRYLCDWGTGVSMWHVDSIRNIMTTFTICTVRTMQLLGMWSSFHCEPDPHILQHYSSFRKNTWRENLAHCLYPFGFMLSGQSDSMENTITLRFLLIQHIADEWWGFWKVDLPFGHFLLSKK